MKTMNASEFKAKCLAILDWVNETGEGVVILKRGKPVARLGPPGLESARTPQEELMGTVTILGDVIAPAIPEDAWEALDPDPE